MLQNSPYISTRPRCPAKTIPSCILRGLPKKRDMALLFIASDLPEALPGLGRKLPHYHKYSYLAFEGQEPANVAKGRWPVLNSPLTVYLPDNEGNIVASPRGKLASREPLAYVVTPFSNRP